MALDPSLSAQQLIDIARSQPELHTEILAHPHCDSQVESEISAMSRHGGLTDHTFTQVYNPHPSDHIDRYGPGSGMTYPAQVPEPFDVKATSTTDPIPSPNPFPTTNGVPITNPMPTTNGAPTTNPVPEAPTSFTPPSTTYNYDSDYQPPGLQITNDYRPQYTYQSDSSGQPTQSPSIKVLLILVLLPILFLVTFGLAIWLVPKVDSPSAEPTSKPAATSNKASATSLDKQAVKLGLSLPDNPKVHQYDLEKGPITIPVPKGFRLSQIADYSPYLGLRKFDSSSKGASVSDIIYRVDDDAVREVVHFPRDSYIHCLSSHYVLFDKFRERNKIYLFDLEKLKTQTIKINPDEKQLYLGQCAISDNTIVLSNNNSLVAIDFNGRTLWEHEATYPSLFEGTEKFILLREDTRHDVLNFKGDLVSSGRFVSMLDDGFVVTFDDRLEFYGSDGKLKEVFKTKLPSMKFRNLSSDQAIEKLNKWSKNPSNDTPAPDFFGDHEIVNRFEIEIDGKVQSKNDMALSCNGEVCFTCDYKQNILTAKKPKESNEPLWQEDIECSGLNKGSYVVMVTAEREPKEVLLVK